MIVLFIAMILLAGGLALTVASIAESHQRRGARPNAAAIALAGGSLTPEGEAELPFLYRMLEPTLDGIARLVGRFSPEGRVEALHRKILQAGLEGVRTPERVLGSQALGGVTGAVVGLLARPGSFPFWIWVPLLGAIGFVIPQALISGKADRRQKELAKAFPEALDLLAITVEAGLGLEQAFQVVTEDLEGPLAEELNRMLREIELGVSRREALGGLRERVCVPEVSAFVVALVQADRMGIAIADVLRVQASQARLARRQRAREQAAKAPVKILFPVIFGVLPSLFLVTLGPAALAIVDAFKGT